MFVSPVDGDAKLLDVQLAALDALVLLGKSNTNVIEEWQLRTNAVGRASTETCPGNVLCISLQTFSCSGIESLFRHACACKNELNTGGTHRSFLKVHILSMSFELRTRGSILVSFQLTVHRTQSRGTPLCRTWCVWWTLGGAAAEIPLSSDTAASGGVRGESGNRVRKRVGRSQETGGSKSGNRLGRVKKYM